MGGGGGGGGGTWVGYIYPPSPYETLTTVRRASCEDKLKENQKLLDSEDSPLGI